MVQFTLPRNSKITKGKAWNPPAKGAEPGTMTQAEFAAFVDTELTKWLKVIADANVTVN